MNSGATQNRWVHEEAGLSNPGPHSAERSRRYYSFGDFTLDGDYGVLRRGGEEVPLRPKSIDVLVYLAEHHGQLVTRTELMNAVWPDTAVTENSLAQCIVEIRRALVDQSQQLIRTVARRGYIFTASVTSVVREFPCEPRPLPAAPIPQARGWKVRGTLAVA